MKILAFLLIGLNFIFLESAEATSFGRRESATISSDNSRPAICLPNDTGEVFLVGWISLMQSYVRNAGAWGVALKSGAKPLELLPGGCVVFGVVPEGYELDNYKVKTHPLNLEVNNTYIFSLIDASRPRDSYTAVFCIGNTASGTVEYLQYTRLADGSELVPPCDGRRNGNAAKHFSPDN